MKPIRAIGSLGTAASGVRRVGLGGILRTAVDATDRALLRTGGPPLAAKVDGVELRGYLRHRGFLEYVSRGMPQERFYRRLVLDALDGQTTFVDAGAHIGVYTLLAARCARRVIAFEPDPYNLAALRWNVATAGCENVDVRAQAVADRNGRATFRAFRSTFSGSLLPREVDEYHELETETVRLDDALANVECGSLVVKLDIEGAEPLALLGMRRILKNTPDLLLVLEVNPDALAAGGSTPEILVGELTDAGLECAFASEARRGLVPLLAHTPTEKGNLVCWRTPVGDAKRATKSMEGYDTTRTRS